MVCICHEVGRNSHSIVTNFGENTRRFSQTKIIRLDQSIPRQALLKPSIDMLRPRLNQSFSGTRLNK
jgi:hypothetical protein